MALKQSKDGYFRTSVSFEWRKYQVAGKTEAEAYKKAGKLRSELESGRRKKRQGVTLATFAKEWLATYHGTGSENDKRYEQIVKGIIVPEDAAKTEIDELFAVPIKKEVVSEATTPNVYKMENDGPHVVVMDFGIKQNILDSLHQWGCDLTIVPSNTTAEEIMNLNPDGIFLSNGPGDPKDIPDVIENVKKLIGKKPMFGICLGHQILGLALGANTYKLKFGHRGSNQPVKNLETGRVYITSQNHGYAVDEASLEGLPLKVTHRSINDGTVEGMRHTKLPIFSVQFHPEASPGPTDNTYLFDQFVSMLPKEE